MNLLKVHFKVKLINMLEDILLHGYLTLIHNFLIFILWENVLKTEKLSKNHNNSKID